MTYSVHTFKVFFALAAICLLASCAAGPISIDKRYHFDNLQQIDEITQYRLHGWQSIDSQSLILQTSPSRYYLIILKTKLTDLAFSEAIIISSTGSKVNANFDYVNVPRFLNVRAPIEAIYVIPNRDAIADIKTQIRSKEEKEEPESGLENNEKITTEKKLGKPVIVSV